MKIVSLQAENVKKLSAVYIEPDGNLVQITGKNGQGKTSVLDAIWWALAGKSNVQTTPVKNGEEKAIIRLDLGELVVIRRFNAKDDGTFTTSIAVENGDGARFKSPQSILDELLGQLTFDPLHFARMHSEGQIEALRSLVSDFDFEASDAAIKKAYDDRTYHNRQAKQYRATFDSLASQIPDDMPEVENIDELMEKYKSGVASNDKVKDHRNAVDRAVADISSAQAELDRLEKTVAQMRQMLSDAEEKHKAAKADLMTAKDKEFELSKIQAGDMIDLSGIEERIEKAKEHSELHNRIKQRDEAKAKADEESSLSERLTAQIETEKGKAREAIIKAELPVKGIEISDGIVMLDGVPFDQASDAQQLMASVGIAMALNPTLKVIRIRDGSLLDMDAMKLLSEMGDKSGYQIWIERVDSSGNVGIVIEEGRVKGQDEPESLLKKPEPETEETESSKPDAPIGNVHLENCNKGDFVGRCKFDEPGCPALAASSEQGDLL